MNDLAEKKRKLRDAVKRAVKLAKECLEDGGHTRFQPDCPICRPEHAFYLRGLRKLLRENEPREKLELLEDFNRSMRSRDEILAKIPDGPLPDLGTHASIAVLEGWADGIIGDAYLEEYMRPYHGCSRCEENLQHYKKLREEHLAEIKVDLVRVTQPDTDEHVDVAVLEQWLDGLVDDAYVEKYMEKRLACAKCRGVYERYKVLVDQKRKRSQS